jgi:hypothetical protein
VGGGRRRRLQRLEEGDEDKDVMRSDEEDEVRGELRMPEEVIFVSIQRSKKNKSVTLGTVVVGGCVSISYLFHASQMPRWENVEGEEVVEEMDGTDTADTYTAQEAITLLGWENVDWDGVVRKIGETMN